MTTRNNPPGAGEPPAEEPAGQYPPGSPEPTAYDPQATYPVEPAQYYAAEPPYVPPPNEPPVYPVGQTPPPSRPTPLPWILGGVAALALIGLLSFFLANSSQDPAVPPTPTLTPTPAPPTNTPLPTSTPLVIVVTATPEPGVPTVALPPTNTAPAATPTAPPTDTAPPAPTNTTAPGLPTVTPAPTNTPAPPPTNTTAPTPAPTDTAAPPTETPVRTPAPPRSTVAVDETPIVDPTSPPAIGTAGPADAGPIEPREGYLTVQYFGHATFYLASGEGPRLLIDPVPPRLGYRLPFFDPLDALLVSHWHEDHTYTQVAPGNTRNYNGLNQDGSFNAVAEEFNGVAVRSVSSFHDRNQGRQLGVNAMWVIDIDGFHVVHLGDLGQVQLTDEQLGALGRPDILMIPVGGGETIGGREARRIVEQLRPRLVIPMHYRTDRTPRDPGLQGMDLAGVEDFLGNQVPDQQPNYVQLRRSDLPQDGTQVLVMDYKQE